MNNYSYEQKINIFKNDIKKIKEKLNYYFSNDFLKDPNEDNYILKQNLFIIEFIFNDIENDFINTKDYIINDGDKNFISNNIENITNNIQLVLFLLSKYNIQTEQFYDKINKIIKREQNKNIENFGWGSIMKAAKKLADKITKKILKPIEKTFKSIFSSIVKFFTNIDKLLNPIIKIGQKYVLPVLDWLYTLAKMFLYLIDTLIPGFSKFMYNFFISFYNKAKQTWMIVPIVYSALHRFFPKYIDFVFVDLIRALGFKKQVYDREQGKMVQVDFFFDDDTIKKLAFTLTIFFTWILFWKNTQTLVTFRDYLITLGLYAIMKFYDLIKFILLNLFKMPINHIFFTELGNLKDPQFVKKKFFQLIELIINNIERFMIFCMIYLILIVTIIKYLIPKIEKAIPTEKEFFLYFKILIYKLLNLNK